MKRIDFTAVLSVVIPLFVYQLTLAPSVTFYDSGEFITAIHSLGSAHSPGYPLFLSYAKPFTYLPFGSIAFRVNIATAVSAAAACYAVYLLVSYLLAEGQSREEARFLPRNRRYIALSAALMFAFSARLWLQSNHDKPYPLIAFLSAMVFYLLLLWREGYSRGYERPSYIYIGCFLSGLAFAAHQTMVLMIPPFIYLILSKDWRLLYRFREMLLSVAFVIVGLSLHLYLPLRATRSPLLNWGDPKTMSQFLWHLLRKGYPVEKPGREPLLVWNQLNAFNIPHEFTWIGLALLFVGLLAFIAKKRDEVWAYLIAVGTFLLVIVGYLNTPKEMIFLTEEFFTPIYLLSAVFMGLGLFHLLRVAVMQYPQMMSKSRGVCAATFLSIFLLPLLLCAMHYRENDQHDNFIAYDYAANSLKTLPPKAIFYTWGDSGAFPLWYLQGVERFREDLSIVHVPHLYFAWYLDAFPELFGKSSLRNDNMATQPPESILALSISEQINKRPVYVDFSTKYSLPLDDFFSIKQHGICYSIGQDSKGVTSAPDLSPWGFYSMRGIDGKFFFKDMDTSKAISIYAYSHLEEGESLLRLGLIPQALERFSAAVKIEPLIKSQVDESLQKYRIVKDN